MFSVHVGSLLDYISCMLASNHPTLSRRYRLEYDQQPEYDRFDRSGGYLSIVPSPERSKLSTMLDMAVVAQYHVGHGSSGTQYRVGHGS